MRIEQRIGRIDRMCQKADKIIVGTLYIRENKRDCKACTRIGPIDADRPMDDLITLSEYRNWHLKIIIIRIKSLDISFIYTKENTSHRYIDNVVTGIICCQMAQSFKTDDKNAMIGGRNEIDAHRRFAFGQIVG